MLIVGAGFAGPLLAFDVPVADSRGMAVIVIVVLKDAVMLQAPIRSWRGYHIDNRCSNNCRPDNQKLVTWYQLFAATLFTHLFTLRSVRTRPPCSRFQGM